MEQASTRTLHSVCYQLLGMNRQQVVSDEKLRAFGKVLSLDDDDAWYQDAIGVLSLARSTGMTLHDAYMSSSRACGWSDVSFVCDAYVRWKSQNGFIDFTDMLIRANEVRPASRWTRLFIDEAQDFSPAAWNFVEHLASTAEVAVVAGDDDQAIFEWSGADPHGIAKFSDHYGADVEVLRKSFRVPHAAHRVAQSIAARLSRRIPKVYDASDSTGVVRAVSSFDALNADDLKGSVVLYRDKSSRDEIDEHLRELKLRYTSHKGKVSPYDRHEATAMRIIAKLREGSTMSKKENDLLRRALSDSALAAFDRRGVDGLRGFSPHALFHESPQWVVDYLSEVDVTGPPDVRLSTIHGFKGAENDKIVLCMGMSDRISVGLANNPDPEHRVWYVGVTRTKHELVTVGGDNEYML